MADNPPATNDTAQLQKDNKFSNMDPQILEYIASLVFMKKGEKADLKEADKEVYDLYNKFQEDVFNLAYRQLSSEKQAELNQIVTEGASQEKIQEFVLKEIPNFQRQLEGYIEKFQKEYLGELAEQLEKYQSQAPEEEKTP